MAVLRALRLLGLGAAMVRGAAQQNYYVTRNAVPLVGQPADPQPNCTSFPKAQCDDEDGGRWTMDMVTWEAQEIVGTFSLPGSGGVVGLYDCATYAICGFRVTMDAEAGDPMAAARVGTNPRQYMVIEDTMGFIGDTCTAYPPTHCPDRYLAMKNWTVHEAVDGALAPDGKVTIGASRCHTFTLCAYRIQFESSGVADPPPEPHLQTPQQYFVVQRSRPLLPTPDLELHPEPVTPECTPELYPEPVSCASLHWYVSEKTWKSQVLKGTLSQNGSLVPFYDCAIYTLCGYANPSLLGWSV